MKKEKSDKQIIKDKYKSLQRQAEDIFLILVQAAKEHFSKYGLTTEEEELFIEAFYPLIPDSEKDEFFKSLGISIEHILSFEYKKSKHIRIN
jgi:endo-alpha-1,4-polygalactosaminidase (GH114 family)